MILVIPKGLKGIIATETLISHIDGEKGQLYYRGHEIREITKRFTFEEVAYLLWFGVFPNVEQLNELQNQLKITGIFLKILWHDHRPTSQKYGLNGCHSDSDFC